MRWIIGVIAGAFLLLTSASAQLSMTGIGGGFGAAAGGCTAATNFLARTSGLSGTETTAYTTMICGLVTDGVITGNLSGATGCGSLLSGLYILATNTTTTASLNLCGTSFGLTTHGSPTFTADQGYTGTGATTDFLDTSYIPSSSAGALTQNSASLFSYVITNRTTFSGTNPEIGCANGAFTNQLYFAPLVGGIGFLEVALNDGHAGPATSATSAKGSWVGNRSGASSTYVRRNATADSTGATSSTGLPDTSIYVLGLNQFGVGQPAASTTTDQVAAAAFGASLTTTQADALSNRVNAYMTALGINVY